MQGTDIEKNRAEYVQRIETQFAHIKGEYEKYKAIADKWEPRVTVSTDVETGKVSFGLKFGGKHVHATVTQQWLSQMDETSAVSSIVDALVESLVVAELRQVFVPEVKRLQAAAKTIQTAGNW